VTALPAFFEALHFSFACGQFDAGATSQHDQVSQRSGPVEDDQIRFWENLLD
jgi:hypothetical protein